MSSLDAMDGNVGSACQVVHFTNQVVHFINTVPYKGAEAPCSPLHRVKPTRRQTAGRLHSCLVVSPNELNHHLHTILVALITTAGQAYPWRIPCRFQKRTGFVALDQLRTVDSERLLKGLGRLAPETVASVLRGLQEMFAE